MLTAHAHAGTAPLGIAHARGARPLTTALMVLAFAALTAACAQVRVHSPLSPVPFTMQTFAVGLAGLAMPAPAAVLSMAIYVLAGVCGAPVFSGGGSGVAHLFAATGGYLVSYPLAAALARAALRSDRGGRFGRAFMAMLAAHAAVFALGVPWLKAATGVPWSEALFQGFVIFLPSTIVKSLLGAAVVAPRRAR
ncbi:MAG: hypothetical protein C0468_05320 [Planctomyces sp.]|nr:hypothetical protein [Planctomyces sp.]MBA4120815.1 hypothetical protein [Isosphaera sp.]